MEHKEHKHVEKRRKEVTDMCMWRKEESSEWCYISGESEYGSMWTVNVNVWMHPCAFVSDCWSESESGIVSDT